MIQYDNLKDATDKLYSTICMYDGMAVQVLEVSSATDPILGTPPFKLKLNTPKQGSMKVIEVELTDPKFSFRQFNLGYANQNSSSVWWYRKPQKQYKQGLTSNQVNHLYSNPEIYARARFEWSKPIIQMLEDDYPPTEVCAQVLADEKAQIIAFHRDVAASYDRLHKDYIVEYRGRKVGQTTNFKTITLLDEFKHLNEAVHEAIRNHV